MTFDSSNGEELETRTTTQSLTEQIRVAMGEGCIRSSRVTTEGTGDINLIEFSYN